MKKQLIYYFYFRKDWCTDEYYTIPEVYLLHIECIKRYGKNFFDKITFICTFDDINAKAIEPLRWYFHEEFLDYCLNVNIKIEQNYPEYREGYYFYTEIINNLYKYDGLICWGHGKQDFKYSKQTIYNWITLCHYINSIQFKKDNIEEKLQDSSKYFYGPILTNSFKGLIYSGSFYWIYPNHIINDKNNNFLILKDIMDWIFDYCIKQNNPINSTMVREISENFVSYFTLCNCLHSQNEIFKLFGPIKRTENGYEEYMPDGDPYCYEYNEYLYRQNIYNYHLMDDYENYKNNIFEQLNINLKDDTIR